MDLKRVITVVSITVACLLSVGRGTARADLILTFQSAVPSGFGSEVIFKYLVQLASPDGQMNAIGVGAPLEFVTLYDIPGFSAALLNTTPGFEFLGASGSLQAIGMTPPNVFITDDPSLPNITISFPNNTSNYGVSGGIVTISSLTVYSPASGLNPTGQFAGLSQSALIGDAFATNQGFVPIPAIPAVPVPEPATGLLLVAGGALAVLNSKDRSWTRPWRQSAASARAGSDRRFW